MKNISVQVLNLFILHSLLNFLITYQTHSHYSVSIILSSPALHVYITYRQKNKAKS